MTPTILTEIAYACAIFSGSCTLVGILFMLFDSEGNAYKSITKYSLFIFLLSLLLAVLSAIPLP